MGTGCICGIELGAMRRYVVGPASLRFSSRSTILRVSSSDVRIVIFEIWISAMKLDDRSPERRLTWLGLHGRTLVPSISVIRRPKVSQRAPLYQFDGWCAESCLIEILEAHDYLDSVRYVADHELLGEIHSLDHYGRSRTELPSTQGISLVMQT